MMEWKNPVWNGTGGIECEVKHPEFGWIPFTAREDDVEAHGRELFAAMQDVAAPYAPPSPEQLLEWEREGMIVSRLQAKVALSEAGLLDAAEAAVEASTDARVKIAWKEASEFRRLSPAILLLQPELGLTDAQLDDIFRAAALVEV